MDDDFRGEHLPISIGDLDESYFRLATADNLAEVSALLIALAKGMPPQASLRQAVCLLLIARSASTGSSTTINMMKSDADKEAFFDLLGATATRTVRSLEDAGLVMTYPSEWDRRTIEIRLTTKGFHLMDEAMDQIKEPDERKA